MLYLIVFLCSFIVFCCILNLDCIECYFLHWKTWMHYCIVESGCRCFAQWFQWFQSLLHLERIAFHQMFTRNCQTQTQIQIPNIYYMFLYAMVIILMCFSHRAVFKRNTNAPQMHSWYAILEQSNADSLSLSSLSAFPLKHDTLSQ